MRRPSPPAGDEPRATKERNQTMTQNEQTPMQYDAFTLQAADPAELEQIEGGIVCTKDQDCGFQVITGSIEPLSINFTKITY
jgi:hypothetical protein